MMRSGPINILDLRDSPWVDGPGRTILQCASMIDPRRCVISVGGFCGASWSAHDYLQAAQSLGLPVYPIPEKRSLDLSLIGQISGVIKAAAIELLHTHDIRSRIFGLLAAKRAGIPTVTTCHGWIANTRKRRLLCLLDQRTLRFADRVIAVSEAMAGQLAGFGVPPQRIRVIRNALVIEDYQPGRDNALRAEWGIPAGALLIGNIGRLSAEKGQELFVRAAREILSSHPAVYFVLVGIGPEESRLRALSRELGIEERVLFAGYRQDMVRVYRSLDLVVQSSYTEGMPNVILEALLMELPVVASSVGGTAEIVKPVSEAFLVQPGRSDELVAAIAKILDDPGHYRELAGSGRRFVAEHFNQDRRVLQLTDVYEEIRAERCGICRVND
jgi:glycosyltransferase involved in cell wall biosynthesis